MNLGPTSSAKTSVQNRQVGVQGNNNISLTDKIGAKSATTLGGGVATGLNAGKNSVNTITVNNTSPEAWEFGTNVALGSLASQNSVSLAAINAANNIGTQSLLALRDSQTESANLLSESLGRAYDIAGNAAPVSDAAAGVMQGETTRKLLIGVGIVIVVGIGLYVYVRNH